MDEKRENVDYNELKERVEKIIYYVMLNEKENQETHLVIKNLVEENKNLKLELSSAKHLIQKQKDEIAAYKNEETIRSNYSYNILLKQFCKINSQVENELKTSKEVIAKIVDLEVLYEECKHTNKSYESIAIKCVLLQEKIKLLIDNLEKYLKKMIN